MKAMKFQFHKGTIKTNNVLRCFKLGINFNSIKVQLKHSSLISRTERNIFQFHKGTIKTVVLLDINQVLYNFNSIKVQLKPVS